VIILVSLMKLDKNSIPKLSIKDIPNIDTIIVFNKVQILLNILYFLKILINKLIKVNFNKIFLNVKIKIQS
jgi:hypothetical protein